MIELNKIYQEDCRETIARIPDNSIDSIVTDPPYEYGFMQKKWDSSGIAFNVELWAGCLRVLKPGGYLLAFGSTRTSHRMICAVEDAGFEIRDSIMWIFGTGFPKSMNLGNGQGTALKPAHEIICVARKPMAEKTVAANVLKYGTGGINIDPCRIKSKKGNGIWGSSNKNCKPGFNDSISVHEYKSEQHELGRFPANLILDEFVADLLDNQAPDAGACAPVKRGQKGKSKGVYGDYAEKGDDGDSFYDDKGAASRFFYCAKSSSDERNAGLYQFGRTKDTDRPNDSIPLANRLHNKSKSFNTHPTVKPVKLIQYLQRLVTPPGGITYDPFGGSGTSAIAAQNEGFNWILSELLLEHYDIAIKRIYNNGGLFL